MSDQLPQYQPFSNLIDPNIPFGGPSDAVVVELPCRTHFREETDEIEWNEVCLIVRGGGSTSIVWLLKLDLFNLTNDMVVD